MTEHCRVHRGSPSPAVLGLPLCLMPRLRHATRAFVLEGDPTPSLSSQPQHVGGCLMRLQQRVEVGVGARVKWLRPPPPCGRGRASHLRRVAREREPQPRAGGSGWEHPAAPQRVAVAGPGLWGQGPEAPSRGKAGGGEASPPGHSLPARPSHGERPPWGRRVPEAGLSSCARSAGTRVARPLASREGESRTEGSG